MKEKSRWPNRKTSSAIFSFIIFCPAELSFSIVAGLWKRIHHLSSTFSPPFIVFPKENGGGKESAGLMMKLFQA